MAKQRLDKIISNLGILSRSECAKAAKAGAITVNGTVIKTPDYKVDPDVDGISYRGQILDTRALVYYMFNKPTGCITANEDKRSKTVFDYIADKRSDLSAVGRLDKDTTGILLITNDGELNHRLLAPKYHVPKRYEAVIDGTLNEEEIALLKRGLDIGDEKPTLPAEFRVLATYDSLKQMCAEEGKNLAVDLPDSESSKVELIITEGRFHQVKRMFTAVGRNVITLHRSSFGPLELDSNLAPGAYRELTLEELKQLNTAAGR